MSTNSKELGVNKHQFHSWLWGRCKVFASIFIL